MQIIVKWRFESRRRYSPTLFGLEIKKGMSSNLMYENNLEQ